ncbi:MAG: hypothetical protein ABIO70_23885 [Pseudomonadota bacterium]
MKACALPLCVLAACEPAPPPPVEEVDWAAATGLAIVRLEEGSLSLDGTAIGALREPGMLRQSRHRKLLQALQLRSGQDPQNRDPPVVPLLSQDRPARIDLSPATPWADLHPVIATAAWAGFGPLGLRLLPAGAEQGPLGIDTLQSPPWAGEPVLGVAPVLEITLGPRTACGALSFEALVADGARRQLPQRLRVVGSEPLIDCAALFSADPDLAAACAGGQRPGEESAPDAPPSLPPGQRALPVAVSGDALVAPPPRAPPCPGAAPCLPPCGTSGSTPASRSSWPPRPTPTPRPSPRSSAPSPTPVPPCPCWPSASPWRRKAISPAPVRRSWAPRVFGWPAPVGSVNTISPRGRVHPLPRSAGIHLAPAVSLETAPSPGCNSCDTSDVLLSLSC